MHFQKSWHGLCLVFCCWQKNDLFLDIQKKMSTSWLIKITCTLFWQTPCKWGCSTYRFLIQSFTDRVSHPFPPDIENIINPKPLKLLSWHFERLFTPHHVSCVTCHVSAAMCHLSRVTCHVSPVTCHIFFSFFFFFKMDKVVKLFEWGFVINGAYPV